MDKGESEKMTIENISRSEIAVQNRDQPSTSSPRRLYSEEHRQYVLNRDRAWKKKLDATEIDELSSSMAGGGLRMFMNAGMFELLRIASYEYCAEFNSKCTMVKDQKNNVVETQYRVYTGDNTHFTINMYHTKSSLLVNGKGIKQFIQKHVYELLNSIESNLQATNCASIKSFNIKIRNIIISTLSAGSVLNDACVADNNRCIEQGRTSQSPVLVELKSDRNGAHVSNGAHVPNDMADDSQYIEQGRTSTSPIIVELEPDSSESTNVAENDPSGKVESEPNNNKFMTVLETIQSDIYEIKHLMRNHISETNEKFERVNNELCSIKRQISLRSGSIDREIEQISDTVSKANEEVKHLSDKVQNKVQSFADQIKHSIQNDTKTQTRNVTSTKKKLESRKKTAKKEQTTTSHVIWKLLL